MKFATCIGSVTWPVSRWTSTEIQVAAVSNVDGTCVKHFRYQSREDISRAILRVDTKIIFPVSWLCTQLNMHPPSLGTSLVAEGRRKDSKKWTAPIRWVARELRNLSNDTVLVLGASGSPVLGLNKTLVAHMLSMKIHLAGKDANRKLSKGFIPAL